MSERTVKCPQCGETVAVPVSGEKVRCPGCGQKFRFDVPSPPPLPAQEPLALKPEGAEAPPLPSQPGVSEVSCPRCGQKVAVPTTGEKVRCPGCGQKFRFDRPVAIAPQATPEAPKAPALVPPLPPAPSPADAEELRALWPTLCRFIAQRFEEGRADEDDHLCFHTQVSRAAALGRQLLPAQAGGSPSYEFITAVLPQTTLGEILRLSLEDFRHLQESLDEAQATLDRCLAAPVIAAAPLPPAAPVARPAAPSRSTVPTLVGVVALFVAAAAVIIVIPVFRDHFRKPERRKELSWAEMRGVPPGPGTPMPTPERPRPKPPEPASKAPRTSLPTFEPPPKTPTPAAPTPEPPAPKAEPEPKAETPEPAPKAEPPKRVLSRWKPAPDGWIDLFNGKTLDGLQADPDSWSVKDGILYGKAPDSVAPLLAQDAPWTDYCLALDAKLLGKQGGLATTHGDLAVFLTDGRARLGYPAGSTRVLDEVSKGLSRTHWHHIEFDVKGPRAEVRVDGKPFLVSSAHAAQPGAPGLQVHDGAVAVKSFRLRMHDTDPDYRAVVLGEGYLAAAKAPIPEDPEAKPAPTPLGPGDHVLLSRANLDNWTKTGSWTLTDGAVVGRAPFGEHAVLATGSPDWRDYTFRARGRLTRRDRQVRDGEYFLVIVRYQDPDLFYCVRFCMEGISEIGYYRAGRFHETGRARCGVGNSFNRWHDIQIDMRGDELTLAIDGNAYPPWTLKGLTRGSVALGVEGAEAAFENVRIRLLK